ncbi:MAG: cytochrome c biogenesis protein ResB [Verrucomicrobiota bacterium]|nr:cytochrome c biogenesis protein ResB [Chthoniobacterales bacterium]MDQ3413933.1 cytochrome c biogenesis protein ResB [Verrucomicrobiota bacterium]
MPEAIVRPFPLKSPLRVLSSLRLTVVCLGLGMLLVFLGTLAQVHLGIHAVQERYFQSLIVFWSPPGASWKIPILPGGYLLGTVLLVNLIAAHGVRFQLTKKKLGIILLHFGVILLLIGQLLTGLFARETQMRIDEGQTAGYSEAPREVELAVIDRTDPNFDQVVAIPESILTRGGTIQNPTLPFTLNIRKFMGNTHLAMRSQMPEGRPSLATAGFGPKIVAEEAPRTVKDDERDLSAAYVEVNGVQGSLGTWLVSNAIPNTQPVTVDGHTYELVMRQRRFYKQFALTLLDFAHDRYAGTDIPKNFSSRVRLLDPERNENREVLISMNDPLRYRGFTFYQSGFDNDDKTTILQVVKNPAMLLPYIACGLVAAGLLVQFSMHLFGFIRKRA